MIKEQISKRISFNFEGQKLIFDTSRRLFSFAKVDGGTKELLNSLRKNNNINYEKVLDLGCGYGAIGIFLKKKFTNSNIFCSDRDSLAIDFTNHNAKLNNVEIETIRSLDFENINSKFSLIACNFPAKLEKEGLEYFMLKSFQYLEKNGVLVMVVVKELEKESQDMIKKKDIEILFKQKSKDYFIFHLRFNKEIEMKNFSYTNSNFLNFKTTKALREFDSMHFISELILENVAKKQLNKKSILVLNPNQGLILEKLKSSKKIYLSSNDLLSLKISSENLKSIGFQDFNLINSDFPLEKADLLIWSIQDEEQKEIIEKLRIFQKNFKEIIIGARLQTLNQVFSKMKIKPKKEIRKGKYSIAEI